MTEPTMQDHIDARQYAIRTAPLEPRHTGAHEGFLAGMLAERAKYEEVLADHRRLVRELDVALNGEEGAAKQASLCDIVGQVTSKRLKLVVADER